ncbi:MAG: hypothetical protein WD052_00040 [Bacteroidales bacterium]
MALKTTTWKDRNIDNLQLTKTFAVKKGITHPVIINFGPGGSVRFLAKYLLHGPSAERDTRARIIRFFESLLRKTGLFPLITNEPEEIVRIFSSLLPKKLLVYDREKKVIMAVNDLVAAKIIDIPVEAEIIDLLEGPVASEADIVIALNIVSRTNDKERALNHIISSVRVGGLVCINIDEPPAGFIKLGQCLFERVN